jgi:hypothetical protein
VTDYTVPPSLTATLTLEGNDTLTDGTVVISNYGTIDSNTDGQAIDFNNVESAASISFTNYAVA